MSDTLWPYGLWPTRLLCPWDPPGKNTGVGWCALLQGLNPHLLLLLHWQGVYLPLVPMAPHSSTLAWKIPWTEEPGGLQSMGSFRVGHDWVTSLSLFTFMHWRRKWQPSPVSLPGKSQGQGILVACRLRCRTESDMTEAT